MGRQYVSMFDIDCSAMAISRAPRHSQYLLLKVPFVVVQLSLHAEIFRQLDGHNCDPTVRPDPNDSVARSPAGSTRGSIFSRAKMDRRVKQLSSTAMTPETGST
jgi:hypothetical protein